MTAKENVENPVNEPWSDHQTPEDVLNDESLSDAQKRRVLESWEHDARELAVAEEENMGGGEPNLLHRVLQALAALPAENERLRGPATKHGGQATPAAASYAAGSAGETEGPKLTEEEARQGEVILKTPRRRMIFIGAIVVSLAALVAAFWIAP